MWPDISLSLFRKQALLSHVGPRRVDRAQRWRRAINKSQNLANSSGGGCGANLYLIFYDNLRAINSHSRRVLCLRGGKKMLIKSGLWWVIFGFIGAARALAGVIFIFAQVELRFCNEMRAIFPTAQILNRGLIEGKSKREANSMHLIPSY